RCSEMPELLVKCNSCQALAGPFQPLSAHVNPVVELEIDHRDDGRVGHALGKRALGVLNGVPPLGVESRDEPADLDEIERKFGLAEIGANRRDEIAEHSRIRLPSFALAERIALSLIPKNTFHRAPSLLDLAQHRAIQAVTPLLFL